MSIAKAHKVTITPRGIGTAGARLSDTPSGRAPRPIKAKSKKELTAMQALKRTSIRNIDAELAELEAWCDEYAEVRADLNAKRKEREALAAKRRAEHLALVADWK